MSQGCNLSPLLFSLLMNDLEDYLKNHPSGSCQLNSYRLQLMMFADVIALLADTEKGLQEPLNDWRNSVVIGTYPSILK